VPIRYFLPFLRIDEESFLVSGITGLSFSLSEISLWQRIKITAPARRRYDPV